MEHQYRFGTTGLINAYGYYYRYYYIITLLSVIYAVGCTSFLSANSPQQYYKTAYISVAVMILILLLRFIYIKIRNLNSDGKKVK